MGLKSMNRVKELREEKRLKQIELAMQLNISQATLSNWERGIHDPDNESLLQLSKFFNCTVDFLLRNSEIRLPASEDTGLTNAYYRIAFDAKESGIDPGDLELAVDFLKRSKNREKGTN